MRLRNWIIRKYKRLPTQWARFLETWVRIPSKPNFFFSIPFFFEIIVLNTFTYVFPWYQAHLDSYNFRSENVEVYAGAHNIKTRESTQVRLNASRYHIYEHYDWDYGYNVAILKLSEPIEFNDYIAPIELNLSIEDLLGK